MAQSDEMKNGGKSDKREVLEAALKPEVKVVEHLQLSRWEVVE